MKQKIRSKPEKELIRRRERSSNSMRKHRAADVRRIMRRAELGRATEDRVANILLKKQAQGELISFARHPANSAEDRAGKDFTVTVMINGEPLTASFGVTITTMRQSADIPLIVIPPEMGDERIWYRICRICEELHRTVLCKRFWEGGDEDAPN